ncbi:aminoglycoside 3'-phosphotransferase/choline kinase family protein [bacterium]|nr:aminoglycoside 3'-phosphotransferase/choline kinase family protein [bacterium]
MNKLPPIWSDQELNAFDRTDPTLRHIVSKIVRSHGYAGERIELFPTGSVLVFRVDNIAVIKLFPHYCQQHFRTEHNALAVSAKHLPGIVPDLHHAGEWDGWSYLIMALQPGIPLDLCWPDLHPQEKASLVRQLAEIVRSLHMIPPAQSDLPRPHWSQFRDTQQERCLERQKQLKLDQYWLDQIPGFLDTVSFPAPQSSRHVILHTEIMNQHLLVERDSGSNRIKGLIDFEPAMIGDFEYELAAIALFVCGQDPYLFPLFLEHYRPDLLGDPELTRRVLAYILLHRYSNLAWYLTFMPPVRSFEECLEYWFR